jgi:tetratricopeptide (TPR) repeat protein
VLDGLEEAAAAGLLTETAPATYAFTHALVRQALYAALSATRRMRLHRQLGEALETLDDREAHVEALAHHFAHAAAGRSATARLGYEDAAAHYERGLQALELAQQPDGAQRCELLVALGEACWGAGDVQKGRQACGQAAELAEKLGDANALARAALGFCGPHRFEPVAEVLRSNASVLQRALVALGDDDSPLRSQLMGRLAMHTDIEQRGPMLARQALEIARRVADKATLADVLPSVMWATRGPDTLHESLALAAELGRVAQEVGDSRLRALAHEWLLDGLLELGDIDGVERELDALQRLADTRREHFFTWVLGVFQAGHALLQGRLEDFETLAHEALAHRGESHDEVAAQIFGLQMVIVNSLQGRLDELVDVVESAAAQYPQLTGWRCGLASVYAQLERGVQARRELEALARVDFRDLPRDRFWLMNMSALSEVVCFLGDVARAQLLYKLLLPYADRWVVSGALMCQGSASRPLGLLATTLSRYEDAARHFEQALTMNAQIRSPLGIAHTQHDYARMLLSRNHPRDNDKALELLTEALATAEQVGLKALAQKTRPLKLTAEAIAPPVRAMPS